MGYVLEFGFCSTKRTSIPRGVNVAHLLRCYTFNVVDVQGSELMYSVERVEHADDFFDSHVEEVEEDEVEEVDGENGETTFIWENVIQLYGNQI